MLKVKLEKTWDNIKVKASFTQKNNEILCIIGPSGCGKTTLLNMISGIITGDNGEIIINDEIIFSKEKNINQSLNKRQIGYIQQKDTLFPHLNVEKNILYGRRKKVYSINMNDILEVLEIKDILHKKPKELSGGQKQRVAIARALAAEPKLLLMDEPFSALDNIMRKKLILVVKDIRNKFNIPIIFITHSLEEAYSLGDRIAIMKYGKIIQIDYKDKIFQKPNCKDVAFFIGIKNILSSDLGEKILKILGYDKLSSICKKENLNLCIWPEHIKLNSLYRIKGEWNNEEKNKLSLKSKSSDNHRGNKCIYGIIVEKVNELNEVNYKIKLLNINKLSYYEDINTLKNINNSEEIIAFTDLKKDDIVLYVKIHGRVCRESSFKCEEVVSIHIEKDHILMIK